MSSGYDDREFLHQGGFRLLEAGGPVRPLHVNRAQVPVGVGKQTNAFGGIVSRSVSLTPGTSADGAAMSSFLLSQASAPAP